MDSSYGLRIVFFQEIKDLVIFKDRYAINGVHTLETKDSIIVTSLRGTVKAYSKNDVTEVMKNAFDKTKGFTDRITHQSGEVTEPVQTLDKGDSLVVTYKDGRAFIYKKEGYIITKVQFLNPSSVKWSVDLGKMSWDDAMKKCASIGMRLPSLDELIATYNFTQGKKWLRDDPYWSSTVLQGRPRIYFGSRTWSLSSDHNNVRCLSGQ